MSKEILNKLRDSIMRLENTDRYNINNDIISALEIVDKNTLIKTLKKDQEKYNKNKI